MIVAESPKSSFDESSVFEIFMMTTLSAPCNPAETISLRDRGSPTMINTFGNCAMMLYSSGVGSKGQRRRTGDRSLSIKWAALKSIRK